MIKVILFSAMVVLVLASTAIVAGITSVEQVLLFVLLAVFFTVWVKGVIEGVPTRRRHIR